MPQLEIDYWDIKTDAKVNDDLKIVEYSEILYSCFFKNILVKNVPCIIKNITSTWNCATNWVEGETINYDHLIKKYGDLMAPVADCDTLSFNAHCKIELKVEEYINYLQKTPKEKILYLKDWHLRKDRPDDPFYEVPFIFASDWLNEFATDQSADDFMFVYIGPQNSWTPLHADVYNSYSWSVNVVGRKKWILFPPGEEEKLKDSLGNLPTTFNADGYHNITYLEVIQEKNDGIFVPSGWYHQVVNLLDTVSINHNWVNGCNIEAVWLALAKCLSSVENEILDLKDSPEYNNQCQLILKSVFGMDFSDFVDFVCHIANKRILQSQGIYRKEYNNYNLGINHIKFDLNMILNVMNLVDSHPIFLNELSQNKIHDFVNIKVAISKIKIS